MEKEFFQISQLSNDICEFLANYIDWVNEQLEKDNQARIGNDLLTELGTESELLEIGSQNWIKGKARIKITIEFAPDTLDSTPETTLDEIRQMTVE
jgi:hypothetical protein